MCGLAEQGFCPLLFVFGETKLSREQEQCLHSNHSQAGQESHQSVIARNLMALVSWLVPKAFVL